MQRSVSGTSNARIAWGGDRYVISDGKSTQYYIDLQKEKARKAKERKQNQTSVSVRRNHEFYSSAWNTEFKETARTENSSSVNNQGSIPRLCARNVIFNLVM